MCKFLMRKLLSVTNVTTSSNPKMAWGFMLENPTRKWTQLRQHLINSGTSQGAQWASLPPPSWTPAGRSCAGNLTLSVVPVTLSALMQRHWRYIEAVFTSFPGSVLTATWSSKILSPWGPTSKYTWELSQIQINLTTSCVKTYFQVWTKFRLLWWHMNFFSKSNS